MNSELRPNGTRTVETTIRIDDTPPERLIQAFLQHGDLAAWWHVTRSLVEPVTGGVWSVAWDHYGKQHTDHLWVGVVSELEARRLVIAPLVQNEPDRPIFGPLALEIFAEGVSSGSSLTVRHHGYQRGEHWDWLHDAVVAGWGGALADMKLWAESLNR